MAYVQGFLLAVPQENRELYRVQAEEAWAIFREYGARAMVEAWEEDLPEGQAASFAAAVKRKPDEAVVFSWIDWPDRESCDDAWVRMMEDPRMQQRDGMPFDAERMMWGGFTPIVDTRG